MPTTVSSAVSAERVQVRGAPAPCESSAPSTAVTMAAGPARDQADDLGRGRC